MRSILIIHIVLLFFNSCAVGQTSNEQFFNVEITSLSNEMEIIRDYIPKYAVIAHRGSTYWTPEETEAAYRWAREIGVDYLEADLQMSKDSVILALHDDNLKRTTNIESYYGDAIPQSRIDYYLKIGYSNEEAEELLKQDEKDFVAYRANSYMYSELLLLDAGTWFNESLPLQAREAYTLQHQYISTLEDLVNYSRGKRLERDENGERIWQITTIEEDNNANQIKVKYLFSYQNDEQWGGNIPGLYLELKEPDLNPIGFEQYLIDELSKHDMNIIVKPEDIATDQYTKAGKVNIGNTNAKVILQTFSSESLKNIASITNGEIPVCYLLWLGSTPEELAQETPAGYADYINYAVENKAHIIGPSIAGEPNNYAELNHPWQHWMIKKAGMLNHPYSFDTQEQIEFYYGGDNNATSELSSYPPPYFDGQFTNRSDLSIRFLMDNGLRATNIDFFDPIELLVKLGY